MSSLDLAVIGNCSFSALVDPLARIVWCCLPRFDGDPRFSGLLQDPEDDGYSAFAVEMLEFAGSSQRYRRNSAIVETFLRGRDGSLIQVIDFAPRFKQYGRMFRPATLMRQVVPLFGTPRIRVRVRPTYDHGRGRPQSTSGSNHVRYPMPDLTLRLTTDAPVTYVTDEIPFILEHPLTFILGGDESLTGPVAETFRDFFERTDDYWREWTRYLALPFEWQDAVVRAAITLKLSNFEETGAVIAAPTTSIPEAPGSGRNWDYRYCWLRDSYFVVDALNALGVTRTMEGYLNYIMNITEASRNGALQPVFGITQSARLDEKEVDSLPGYRGMGPVRIGNDAYRQIQNDGYGSAILSCAQMFFDMRLTRDRRRGPVPPPGSSGRARGGVVGSARRGHLGTAQPGRGSYLFERDLLGGMRPTRPDRRAAGIEGARRLLVAHRRRHARKDRRRRVERGYRQLRLDLRRQRGRRGAAPAAAAGVPVGR